MSASEDTPQPSLPPIHRIREPHMHHMSTRIRWFKALGYEVKEISAFLGVRYQQVRNVVTTQPKRMAREDLPPLTVELLDLETDLEAMESQALTQQMAAQRSQDRSARKETNKARRRLKALPDGGPSELIEYTDNDISDEELDRLDNQ